MEQNEKIDIEMADMVGKAYFKIATWYNEDFGTDKERQENLKHVCVEVIQQVLEDTFLQLNGVSTGTKTVTQEEEETTGEATILPPPSSNTGQMFQASEDPLAKIIRENLNDNDSNT